MKWIKVPSGGQIRGEGEWKTIKQAHITEQEWEWNNQSGYLPTYVGDEAPKEEPKLVWYVSPIKEPE